MSVPASIVSGSGVRIRKCSHSGVMTSRFPASAKNVKTRSMGAAKRTEHRSSGITAAFRGGMSWVRGTGSSRPGP